MTALEPPSQDISIAVAAYPDAGEMRRLRAGRLRFFRTIAESVGVQAPTAGVVVAPAVLASISGGGTFSGFEAAATLGEESRRPRRLIPPAIAGSLAVVAVFTIGVTAVVTNAYPSTSQLAAARCPWSRSRARSWPAG